MPTHFMQKVVIPQQPPLADRCYFAPVDIAGEEYLRKLKPGATIRADIKRPRNAKMHRLFWGLMGKVFENQDRYPSIDLMVAAIKIALGECDTVVLPSGKVCYVPKSISFAKMGQDEFEMFFRRCCDMIAKHVIPGIDEDELRREVEEMIGMSRRNS